MLLVLMQKSDFLQMQISSMMVVRSWIDIWHPYVMPLPFHQYAVATKQPDVTIHTDKIYLNKANQQYLKDEEIKSYCKPLGHPSKESKTPEFIAKMTRAVGERNEIECSFGTGKRIYRANNIRAKLPETSECWTGMCYFVRNVMKFLRELCLVLFRIWLRFKFLTNLERKVRYAPSLAIY